MLDLLYKNLLKPRSCKDLGKGNSDSKPPGNFRENFRFRGKFLEIISGDNTMPQWFS